LIGIPLSGESQRVSGPLCDTWRFRGDFLRTVCPPKWPPYR
jgi:hypothetical protein